MHTESLLLAAGTSSRMGQPKALLPWQGKTLIEFQIDQLLVGGAEHVVVVLGHEAAAIHRVVDLRPRTTIVVNREHSTGKASSVRAGMDALSLRADVMLLLSVDQPRSAPLIRKLIRAHEAAGALITVPAFDGRQGHPAIFGRALFPEIRAIDEQSHGLRAVRRRHAAYTHIVAAASQECLIDINTPEDYQAAFALFASREYDDREAVG